MGAASIAAMVIVSGRIFVETGRRDDFVSASLEAVALARRTEGCLDFVVAPDPLDADRVNVYEEWESEGALTAFRGEGPGDDLSALIQRAEVSQREVS
jgi:quinol monooxygenase YgiN